MPRGRWFGVLVVFAGMVGLIPAMASPITIGSLVGSKNATLDGQAPLANTTVLSGDRLQVNDGLALVALNQGNRMVLGRDTDVSFLQEADGVTVSLTSGNMSLYHSEASRGFRVKIGDVTVVPAEGYKTLGQVAMVDGLVVVTAKDGALQIEKAGTTKDVSQGKTITIATTAAEAPAPNQSEPGNQHVKRIKPAILLILGSAALVGGIAWAIVATRSGTPASPSAP